MAAIRILGVAVVLMFLAGASPPAGNGSAPASKNAAPPSADQPVMLAVVNATYQDFLDDLAAAWSEYRPKLEFMFEPPYQPPAVFVEYVSPDGRLRVLGLPHNPGGSYLRDWLKSKASVDYTGEANLASADLPLAALGLPLAYPAVVFFELDDHTSAVLCVTSPLSTPEGEWHTDEKFYSAELSAKYVPERLRYWQDIQSSVADQTGQIVLDTTPMLKREHGGPVGRGVIWTIVSEPTERQHLASLLSTIAPDESERWVLWEEPGHGEALEFYLYPPLAETRALEFCYAPIRHRGLGEPYAGPVVSHAVEPAYLIDEVSKWDTILAGFFELRNGSVEVLLFHGYREPQP